MTLYIPEQILNDAEITVEEVANFPNSKDPNTLFENASKIFRVFNGLDRHWHEYKRPLPTQFYEEIIDYLSSEQHTTKSKAFKSVIESPMNILRLSESISDENEREFNNLFNLQLIPFTKDCLEHHQYTTNEGCDDYWRLFLACSATMKTTRNFRGLLDIFETVIENTKRIYLEPTIPHFINCIDMCNKRESQVLIDMYFFLVENGNEDEFFDTFISYYGFVDKFDEFVEKIPSFLQKLKKWMNAKNKIAFVMKITCAEFRQSSEIAKKLLQYNVIKSEDFNLYFMVDRENLRPLTCNESDNVWLDNLDKHLHKYSFRALNFGSGKLILVDEVDENDKVDNEEMSNSEQSSEEASSNDDDENDE